MGWLEEVFQEKDSDINKLPASVADDTDNQEEINHRNNYFNNN